MFYAFSFYLKSWNLYTKYNFLIASIWYTTQPLALSSSTQNSEKLNQAGFKSPPPGVIIPVFLQFNGRRTFTASLLPCSHQADILGCVHIACSDLMIASLLQVVTRLMEVDYQDLSSTSLMPVVSTTCSKSVNINLQQVWFSQTWCNLK